MLVENFSIYNDIYDLKIIQPEELAEQNYGDYLNSVGRLICDLFNSTSKSKKYMKKMYLKINSGKELFKYKFAVMEFRKFKN